MICKFNSNITFEEVRDNGNRWYYLEKDGKQIGYAWVHSPFQWNQVNNQTGAFIYNNNCYTIQAQYWGSEFPWRVYDQNSQLQMTMYDDEDLVIADVKKAFSKETVKKERHLHYQRIFAGGREFKAFSLSVGGRNGYYYVFKENDKTVAEVNLLDKVIFTGRFLDLYIIDDPQIILTVLLYCFILHMYMFYHTNESIIHGYSDDGGNTGLEVWSKDKPYLASIFDREFIDDMILKDKFGGGSNG